MKTITEDRQDVYTRITTAIVAELEKGTRPWMRPWSAEHAAGRITRPLRHDGQPYAGINVLSLWASVTAQGFTAPIWMTYRQAIGFSAHVRKGEKGSPVVYANTFVRNETDAMSGDDVERAVHYLKAYTVFNVEQIDGLPAQYYALDGTPRVAPPERIAHAEQFFAATGAELSHGGSRAFYRPSTDSIVLPMFEAFPDAESYYATLAHESTHWTGHDSRLARDFGSSRFGSEGYAVEELVAELAAAFLCTDLDLALEPREDHVSYIANWLTVLKDDNRAIFTAASHAQRAVDFLHRLQPSVPPADFGLGGRHPGADVRSSDWTGREGIEPSKW
jgi:antirestriction protein ArdC